MNQDIQKARADGIQLSLDLRGRDAAWVILQTLSSLRKLAAGQALLLEADDASLNSLLPLVLSGRGDLLEEHTCRSGLCRLVIRKGSTPPHPQTRHPHKEQEK